MSITSERIREQPFFHALADDAAEEIETLEKELDQLRAENARLKVELHDADEALKAVEKSLADVDYRGTYADGIMYLKAQLAAAQVEAQRYRFLRDEWFREDDPLRDKPRPSDLVA